MSALLTSLFRLTPVQLKALERLSIRSAAELLLYLPSRYEATGDYKPINELAAGDEVVIHGKVIKAKTSKAWKKKMPMGEVVLEDHNGVIKAIWFHQAYMAKKVPEGSWAKLRGKVTARASSAKSSASQGTELYISNPDIEAIDESQAGEHLFSHGDTNQRPLVPVYPETRGLSSTWFYYHIEQLLKKNLHQDLVDPIPADILKKYNLPSIKTAVVWVHSPERAADAEAARKRFAFQEIFFIQVSRLADKQAYQSQPSYKIEADDKSLKDFLSRFPFAPTEAQTRAIGEVIKDLAAGKPMTRLLEGDVGSGKTLVAAATAQAVVNRELEVAYMVPTEILARQHFAAFTSYFEHSGIQVGLLTGSECLKFPSKINPKEPTHISRSQLLKWVAEGQIPVLVGTHTLIQKAVKFRNLAYVIIDEQHRFGVMQRAKLVKKESKIAPHLLSMTATPIPRTLALTIYGDLDLTLLDQMPSGRKPVITEIIAPEKRKEIYEHIRAELREGRQAYVICPRIDEPDPTKELALQAKSAKSEQARLRKEVFPEYQIGLLHSKMSPSDKEEEMADFKSGKIDILVATSVVEVGVNVPNATLIIIEGAERFGLAQLHQLRGRVIRSNHQAYCYLFSESKSKTSVDRLKALKAAKNGFELAELDLALRGAGELVGERQWGVSDIGMEAIKNIKMVEAARHEAQTLLKEDASLSKHPLLKSHLATRHTIDHFE
jgi:ATP-dependent DNA helicase RecG